MPLRSSASAALGAALVLLASSAGPLGCHSAGEDETSPGAATTRTDAGTVDAAPAAAESSAAPSAAAQGASAQAPTVTVFKSPTCGCCKNWVDHMQEHGFKVVSRDLSDVTPIKRAHGVPDAMHSCHTALVGGYVVEGHVPADLVARLLKERPDVAGIAVPGMPMGSPGMEGAFSERYDVLTFDKTGRTTVFARR